MFLSFFLHTCKNINLKQVQRSFDFHSDLANLGKIFNFSETQVSIPVRRELITILWKSLVFNLVYVQVSHDLHHAIQIWIDTFSVFYHLFYLASASRHSALFSLSSFAAISDYSWPIMNLKQLLICLSYYHPFDLLVNTTSLCKILALLFSSGLDSRLRETLVTC